VRWNGRQTLRLLVTAAAGALVGAGLCAFFYATHPGLVVDFDRDVPRGLWRGFYPIERSPDGLTFAWTADRASLRIPGLDRHRSWTVHVRFRGARPDPDTLPEVTIAVDGTAAETVRAPNDFAEISVPIPARSRATGVELTLLVSNTFRPGPNDARALGIVVDRITIESVSGAALPPFPALLSLSICSALF
jgi:hypothetical protein